MINKLLRAIFLIFLFSFSFSLFANNEEDEADRRIEKIFTAMDVITEMYDDPDNIEFDSRYTVVIGNVVTLKFSVEDKFGIKTSYILNIIINEPFDNNLG